MECAVNVEKPRRIRNKEKHMIDFNRPAFTGKEFEYIHVTQWDGECSAATGSTRCILHGWKSAFMWVI